MTITVVTISKVLIDEAGIEMLLRGYGAFDKVGMIDPVGLTDGRGVTEITETKGAVPVLIGGAVPKERGAVPRLRVTEEAFVETGLEEPGTMEPVLAGRLGSKIDELGNCTGAGCALAHLLLVKYPLRTSAYGFPFTALFSEKVASYSITPPKALGYLHWKASIMVLASAGCRYMALSTTTCGSGAAGSPKKTLACLLRDCVLATFTQPSKEMLLVAGPPLAP